jgi:hypothetical protein
MIILKNLVKTEYPRALLLPHLIKSTGSKWHFIIHPALGKLLFGHPVTACSLEIISQISQPAVFFSQKKLASSTFGQPDQPK